MVDSPMPMTFIRHRGFFDYGVLLKSIQDWYTSEDFIFHAGAYKHKAGDTGAETTYEVRGEKKVTGYVRFKIEVRLRIFNMVDVEVIREGKKLKLQEGQVQIEILPILELDWQKRFGGSKFLSWLDNFFRNYIIKYKIGDYWEDMVLLYTRQFAIKIRETLGQEVV